MYSGVPAEGESIQRKDYQQATGVGMMHALPGFVRAVGAWRLRDIVSGACGVTAGTHSPM